MVLFSGYEEDSASHTQRVARMLPKETQRAPIIWERIIKAKFKTKHRRIKLSIKQCYDQPIEDTKGHFYNTLQQTLEQRKKRKKKEVTIVMGDMNIKIGADDKGYEQVMGKHILGH